MHQRRRQRSQPSDSASRPWKLGAPRVPRTESRTEGLGCACRCGTSPRSSARWVSWYKHVSEYVRLRGSPWQEDPLLGLLQETILEAHLGLLPSGAVASRRQEPAGPPVRPPLKALLRLLSFFLWHVCISCCSLRSCWRASFLKSLILRCRNRAAVLGREWMQDNGGEGPDTGMGPCKRRIASSHLYS
jgi:hypothetical protein